MKVGEEDPRCPGVRYDMRVTTQDPEMDERDKEIGLHSYDDYDDDEGITEQTSHLMGSVGNEYHITLVVMKSQSSRL